LAPCFIITPGTQEADAGDDLGGHPGGIGARAGKGVTAEDHEQGGTQAHQGIRPQPGQPGPPLPLESDQGAEAQAGQNPQNHVEEFHGVHLRIDRSGTTAWETWAHAGCAHEK
jgi:hypothetical protein